MKNLRKLLYGSLSLLVFTTSCEYNETPLDEDIVAANEGAVLTTVSTVGGTINKLDPAQSTLENTVLFNDFDENDTVESIDLYLLFADTTPVNNEVITVDEAFIENVPGSAFAIGDSGFPEHTYSLSGDTMLDLVGLTADDIDGGDLFILRYVLNLTDGRSFSAADTGVNVRTTSHSTPFRYSSVVVCFKTPEPGDYTLTMEDVYGDGWNGGFITISIDGVETTHATSGPLKVETITVPAGTSRFLFTYTAGDWEGENLYTFADPNGVILLEDGIGDGNRADGPAEGEQFNTCD
ncbi:hypothetical protein PXC01_07345 [Maribacter sp. M208]|uniref:hypothetical protein n=1 Tax=Maribacter TaxID=252356 RepID=UPI0023ED8FAA|nr:MULTISPECIES: hypothetical protein [Maribacter]MDF4221395.1 hypothetical protein [Maribacter huludaoensis]